MKAKTGILTLFLGFGGILASCSSEQEVTPESTGKGKVTLDLTSSVQFAATRVADESSYQQFDNYNVSIEDQRGSSKFSGTFAQLQQRMPLELDRGSYTIKANDGTAHAASRDEFFVEGENTFSIEAGKTVTTSVNCVPTCGKVSATFDAEMATYYNEYYVRFSGTEALGTGNAAWSKEDTAPYYMTLNPAGENVTFTVHLTAKDDYATLLADGTKKTDTEATGTFRLARNKAYKLRIKPSYTPSTEGGLSIVIVIDETTNDKVMNIEVPVTWI